MSTDTNKLKWLLSLVLIFGGFAIYEVFDVLATDFADKKYSWVFKIIAEFGLFSSVMVSVGHFHHWLIAAEVHKESEKSFHNALIKYVDKILLSAVKRNFSGITNKELNFSEILRQLQPGDYVYWLITFVPRYKHQCKELENAVRDGTHFRMIIIKEGCPAAELRAREITDYSSEEFSDHAKFFKTSLEEVVSRSDEKTAGSLGVFISDGLPSVPLFIVIHNKSSEVEVYSSFYLSEPIGRMPFLKWQSELTYNRNKPAFESENWNIPELFIDYFHKRWDFERQRIGIGTENEPVEHVEFLYAPASAKKNCSMLSTKHNK